MVRGARQIWLATLLVCSAEASMCVREIHKADYLFKVITGADHHSSAVLIAPDLAITVAHGLAVNEEVRLQRTNGDTHLSAELLEVYWGHDLALLKLAKPMAGAIPFARQKAVLQEPVWTSGFNESGDVAVHYGVVQQASIGKLLATARIAPGGSGGALLRCADESSTPELVGILQAYRLRLIAGRRLDIGVSVSLPINLVAQFLKQQSYSREVATQVGATKRRNSRGK